MTESAFFQDLAAVMAIAGLAAALFSRLKWPKVFGYLLVGILMNEHTWGGSFLADVASVKTLSQLGIVFLMFTMGLQFSTSQLRKVGNVAIPTAVVDTIGMTWLGYTVGTRLFGWGAVPSLFLGVAVCDSATTLLAKMIGELGWSDRPFVKKAIGTSVCEDIVCVGLLALVTGVANGRGMSVTTVGISLGGLFLFFLATIVFGLIVLPRTLASVARRGDDESLLLTVLGCCFLVAWVAYKLEFSLALGAFLVGILGASSTVRDRLARLVEPLRAMFAAMFFVSIGLLVDPAACLSNLGMILLLSLVVVGGKAVNCFVGAILTGESVKTAVQMAFSLAQIGEFAFMVALLYVNLTGDMTSPLFQVTVGVSLLTTFLNPFLIRLSDPFGEWAERQCPARVCRWLETYRAFLERYRSGRGGTDARRRVRTLFVEIVVIAVLGGAVSAALLMLDRYDWSRFSDFLERHDAYILLMFANVFLVGLVAPLARLTKQLAASLGDVLLDEGAAKWQQAVRPIVRLSVFLAVFGAYFIEIAMINTIALPGRHSIEWGAVAVLVIVGVIGWRFFLKASARAKRRFDEALAIDARLANLGRMITVTVPENTYHRFKLSASSRAIGATVVTLDIRAKTGASVVAVERGGKLVRNIGPDWIFAAGDTLVAVGDDKQVSALKELLGD